MSFLSRLKHALTAPDDPSLTEPVTRTPAQVEAEALRFETDRMVDTVTRTLPSGIWQRDMIAGVHPPPRRKDRYDHP